MYRFLFVAALLALPVSAANTTQVCSRIAENISSASNVYFPGSDNYVKDMAHNILSSATNATCSVEPGSVHDIGTVLQILGETRTPFAVKGGGHATNPNTSSTTGVEIAMTRFSQIFYDSQTQSATVGAGAIWDDVYRTLEPLGVIVPGSRILGVGVAGSTLGGGYTWKTNQYGLTLDGVLAYELVLPDGRVVNVTEDSYPDLFFGLRGGFDNFGIVTKFVFKTFPQGQVWGGPIAWAGEDNIDTATSALTTYLNNVTDPKASLLFSYSYLGNMFIANALIFYDAPNPPPGIFDGFLAIPPLATNVSTQSFLSLVASAGKLDGFRGAYNAVSFPSFPADVLKAMRNETTFWGKRLTPHSLYGLSYDIEVYLPTILDHTTSPSAYPPTRARAYSPSSLTVAWSEAEADDAFFDAMRQSATVLQKVATDGQRVPLYPGYAIFGTPLEDMYGDNLERLREIKRVVDPANVMGLTGGFKF